MSKDALSPAAIQSLYDHLAPVYDWFELFESHAKAKGRQALDLRPGQRILEVGVGTGKELARIWEAIAPEGTAIGIDISRVMLSLTRRRAQLPLLQADAHCLPFGEESFDRLYCAYVLDLLPLADIPGILQEFHRVLRPGGRMVLISLTEGVNFFSRRLVSLWKAVFALSPGLCGGCRPLQLSRMIQQAGFAIASHEVILQLAVASEVISAFR
jgi:demethylmenaquinone methyltransferase/2-methoxy-6-polyprenyl-1,4-benzoquinol methylase